MLVFLDYIELILRLKNITHCFFQGYLMQSFQPFTTRLWILYVFRLVNKILQGSLVFEHIEGDFSQLFCI